MSTLVMDELFPNVIFSQDIVIKKNLGVAYIRPWIYKQGTLVDGDLVCRVKDGMDLIKEVSINYADINSNITAPYAHGFIRFDMSPLTLLLQSYEDEHTFTFEFEMINHTLDQANFIAINRSWENKIYDTTTPAPNDMVEPAGIEIYEYKENL